MQGTHGCRRGALLVEAKGLREEHGGGVESELWRSAIHIMRAPSRIPLKQNGSRPVILGPGAKNFGAVGRIPGQSLCTGWSGTAHAPAIRSAARWRNLCKASGLRVGNVFHYPEMAICTTHPYSIHLFR